MKTRGSEATIRDVAREAGVSIATVSRVLNDSAAVRPDTARRVSEAMASVGYAQGRASRPASRLVIAVLPNLNNPFYSEIILGLQASAKTHALEVLLHAEANVERHAARLCSLLAMSRACGLILLSPVGSADVLSSLNEAAPLVQCAEFNEESPLPYVGVDDVAAARSATEALLHAGRRRIALINGPDKYKYARHRRQGYEEALRSAGLQVDPLLMASVTEMGFDSSMAVANQMLGSSAHPDAILAASDMYAAAVVKAAATNGLRIPHDLSLISFDNTYISQLHHPSVTSVGLPRFQLGYTAMEVLAERLKGGAPGGPKQFLLHTELVMRDSV